MTSESDATAGSNSTSLTSGETEPTTVGSDELGVGGLEHRLHDRGGHHRSEHGLER